MFTIREIFRIPSDGQFWLATMWRNSHPGAQEPSPNALSIITPDWDTSEGGAGQLYLAECLANMVIKSLVTCG
jgi:hypothetical protein